MRSLVLTYCFAVAPCQAQTLDAWLETMIMRLTYDLETVARECTFSMRERAHWARLQHGAMADEQRTHLLFGDPRHWRLHHASGDGESVGIGGIRVDYARSGSRAWDLLNGTLITYSDGHGRAFGKEDLNQPVRARLASFGYCMTGGLHLVNILGLRQRKCSRLPGDAWELQASGGPESITYMGSWSDKVGRGSVERVIVTASSVLSRVGEYWEMSRWTVCPTTGWDIAGVVHGYDARGVLTSERSMAPVVGVPRGSLGPALSVPKPGEEVPLMGRAELREWRRQDDGREEYYVNDHGKWLPVAVESNDMISRERKLNVAGWVLACLVLGHGLACKRLPLGHRGIVPATPKT
ncbi:MAG: hypothetical protein JNK49_02930 [Planctomycetes bacterium]|nr:hypothetical protein [Planctomycetota bacterium]